MAVNRATPHSFFEVNSFDIHIQPTADEWPITDWVCIDCSGHIQQILNGYH